MDLVPSNVRVHPSYFFQQRTYAGGQKLLSEGVVEQNQAFVVKEGIVLFTREELRAPNAETSQNAVATVL